MKPSERIKELGRSCYTDERREYGIPEVEIVTKGLLLFLDEIIPEFNSNHHLTEVEDTLAKLLEDASKSVVVDSVALAITLIDGLRKQGFCFVKVTNI